MVVTEVIITANINTILLLLQWQKDSLNWGLILRGNRCRKTSSTPQVCQKTANAENLKNFCHVVTFAQGHNQKSTLKNTHYEHFPTHPQSLSLSLFLKPYRQKRKFLLPNEILIISFFLINTFFPLALHNFLLDYLSHSPCFLIIIFVYIFLS